VPEVDLKPWGKNNKKKYGAAVKALCTMMGVAYKPVREGGDRSPGRMASSGRPAVPHLPVQPADSRPIVVYGKRSYRVVPMPGTEGRSQKPIDTFGDPERPPWHTQGKARNRKPWSF